MQGFQIIVFSKCQYVSFYYLPDCRQKKKWRPNLLYWISCQPATTNLKYMNKKIVKSTALNFSKLTPNIAVLHHWNSFFFQKNFRFLSINIRDTRKDYPISLLIKYVHRKLISYPLYLTKTFKLQLYSNVSVFASYGYVRIHLV